MLVWVMIILAACSTSPRGGGATRGDSSPAGIDAAADSGLSDASFDASFDGPEGATLDARADGSSDAVADGTIDGGDCPGLTACRERGECEEVGRECTSNPDCDPFGFCVTRGSDYWCTRFCDEENVCPAAFVCEMVSEVSLCTPRCE